MSVYVPRFLEIDNYKTVDIKEYLKKGEIELIIEPKDNEFYCFHCGSQINNIHSRYRMRIRHLDLMGLFPNAILMI